jgi:hypothetical protein
MHDNRGQDCQRHSADTARPGSNEKESDDTALLLTAMEEALASLSAGMTQGAADTLREAMDRLKEAT